MSSDRTMTRGCSMARWREEAGWEEEGGWEDGRDRKELEPTVAPMKGEVGLEPRMVSTLLLPLVPLPALPAWCSSALS